MASVIGIVGPIGAGKDSAADYIAEKYGYTIFSFRDIIKDLMDKAGIEATREKMQAFSREQRDKYGEEIFSKAILAKIIETKCEKAIVKELRTAGDIKIIKSHFKNDMKIIKVVATKEVRFERMRSRSRTGDPITLEEFEHQEQREEELGYTKALNFCDYVVFNSGSWEDLRKRLDNAMEKLHEDKSLKRRRFL